MKTIVLIGMMGAGKTDTGKALANQLGIKFIDLDKEIEIREKISIADIFSNFGEKYFRKREKEILQEVIKYENLVLSLGGGTFEDKNIQKLLLSNTTVIYLETTSKEILKRIKNDTTRPLLKNNMNIEKINELINLRNKNYKLAPYTIVTDNKDINDVVGEIMRCVDLK